MEEQTLLEIEDYHDIASNVDPDDLTLAQSALDKKTKASIAAITSELLQHLTSCFVAFHRAGDRDKAVTYSLLISKFADLRTEELLKDNPDIGSDDIRQVLVSEGAYIPVELTT